MIIINTISKKDRLRNLEMGIYARTIPQVIEARTLIIPKTKLDPHKIVKTNQTLCF